MIFFFLSLSNYVQVWLDSNGVDRRENKTLLQKDVIVSGVLEEMNKVSFNKMFELQKYEIQIQKCTALLNQLKELYDELGENLESSFQNPDKYLNDSKMVQIQERIKQVEDVKVLILYLIINYQYKRIKATQAYIKELLSDYSYLNINSSNAVDEFDKLIFSYVENNAPLPISNQFLELYVERKKVLSSLLVRLSNSYNSIE